MRAADRAAEVSRLMLAYRGQIARKPEVRDLAGIIRDTLPVAKQSLPDHVALKATFPETGPRVLADAAQMGYVVTHLVENGGEAIGDSRGEIDIRVEILPAAAVDSARLFPVDWDPPADRLACLTVADTGCGVAEEHIDQLFDPYFTTKAPVRGLGLAVVLGTVTAHGGAVAVESRPDRGSRFRVLLPLWEGRAAMPTGKEAAGDTSFQGGGMVLLVDDQAPVREVTRAMLERMGFSVLAAENGAEAVTRFADHRNEIRCVICDLTMPGMNGWETLRTLRAMRADLPAILASGYDEAEVMAKEHHELARSFLLKPYQKADLRKALRRALEGSDGSIS
jgi:CheY-like chemotaxis protein